MFPRLDEEQNNQAHPMSTQALAMNCEAVHVIVEHYGPNPVHIQPLQVEAHISDMFPVHFMDAYL